MSIEGFDISSGFEEFGEFWELITGEWGGKRAVTETNEVELENVRKRASKIFQFKQPGGFGFSQTKELVSSRKTRHWEIIDSLCSKQASYPSKENRWLNDLSQRQIDILSFGPEECYAPLQGTRYFPLVDADRGNNRLSFMESISPWLARGDLNEKPILAHQYQNPQAMQCGFKKSFQKACHKVGKTWKKHKVEILIGAAIVVVIVVTVVVVASTGGAAGGAIAAGGCAALNELVNGNGKDRPPSEFPSDPDQPFPVTLVKEEKPVADKALSTEEKWDNIKNSSYFTEKGIEPQSSSNLGMPPLPPDPIRPWIPAAPCLVPIEKQEKPKEIVHPIPSESPVSPAHRSLNPNQPMKFGQWYTEYMDKEENGVLYYSEEEFAKPHDATKTFELNPFIKDKKEQTSYDVNILCQDEMAFAPKAWHERNQVVPIPTSEKLPTLGASNKEMLIMGINGIGTDIEAARDHQAYLKKFVPDNVGVDFIYNNSNSIAVDFIESLGLNYLGFSPNTANLLKETWAEFHEYHEDNPAKKILHICHSQGTIHTYNALIDCPQEIRDRLLIIEIAPAKIIPDGVSYRCLRYASEHDFVHLGELFHAGFLDPSETGMSKRLEMIQNAREGLTLLAPHPDAEKFDHDLQSPAFVSSLKDPMEDYVLRNGEYSE